jgi:hypothetical protein
MNKKNLDKEGVLEFYKTDLLYYEKYKTLSNKYKCKPRKPGLSEIVSENIIKFCLNKNNILCTNNITSGDLIVDNKYKYECKCFTSIGPISFGPKEEWEKLILLDGREWFNNKCFTSIGPISFGPKEEWEKLILLDGREWFNNKFKIILVNLKNNDTIWLNIKMNKTETYKNQCDQKRRPRIGWITLEKQIPKEYINIIFEGNIEDILF